MTLYTIYAPLGPADAPPDPLALTFVKEGFCWPALFFPLPWLVFRRMWLVLALYVAVGLGVTVAGTSLEDASPAVAAVSVVAYILLPLLFALEGNGLRRFTLEGAGYRLVDVVEGRRLWEAELRYFLRTPVAGTPAAPPAEIAAPAWKPTGEAEVVGLFPTPGG